MNRNTHYDNQVIVVTGMHRSGTSLLANYLNACGLHVGEALHPASKFNKAGYYEDVEFIKFHEDVLSRNHETWYLLDGPKHFAFSESEVRRAHDLITNRQALSVWGWKDPRTTLFLTEWKALLPSAKFIFVFRRPAEVVHSLARRRDDKLLLRLPGGQAAFRYLHSLWLWVEYNRRLVEFAKRHQESTAIVYLEDVISGSVSPVKFMRSAWNVTGLEEKSYEEVFDKHLLRRDRRVGLRLLEVLSPRARSTFSAMMRIRLKP